MTTKWLLTSWDSPVLSCWLHTAPTSWLAWDSAYLAPWCPPAPSGTSPPLTTHDSHVTDQSTSGTSPPLTPHDSHVTDRSTCPSHATDQPLWQSHVFIVVCLSVRQNIQTNLHEIFREGWQWANKQLIKFWWQSRPQSVYRDCFWIRHYWQIRKMVFTDCTAWCTSAWHTLTGIAIATMTSLRHQPLEKVCTVPVLLVITATTILTARIIVLLLQERCGSHSTDWDGMVIDAYRYSIM